MLRQVGQGSAPPGKIISPFEGLSRPPPVAIVREMRDGRVGMRLALYVMRADERKRIRRPLEPHRFAERRLDRAHPPL
jgi:hypothetical protein